MMITLTLSGTVKRPRGGSALVLALMVTSLLLVVAMAFATFVRMEIKRVAEHQRQTQARRHAVLGLHLAMARLQYAAGPDQRVTATAESLADAGVPGTGTSHWSGVWRPGASARGDGREPAPELLDWLVSGREEAPGVNPGQYASGLRPDGGTSRADEVVLVGPGTLGTPDPATGVTVEDFVAAPRVRGDDGLGYAYWVGEENVKARVNLADHESGDVSDRLWTAFAPRSAPAGAMEDLESLPRFDPAWERVASSPGTALLYPGAASRLRARFHEASLYSASVLADPKSGGLKKDLSLAFELDDTDFNRSEFALAMDADDPVRTNPGQNFSNKAVFAERDAGLYAADGGASPQRDYLPGPTWHYLRDFYRLYKQVDPVTGALDARPMTPNRRTGQKAPDSLIKSFTVPNIRYTNESNALRQTLDGDLKILPTGVEAHPELQRLILMYGLILDGGQLHLVLEPVAVVHNPFNVPVEMTGMLGLWADVDQAIRVETFMSGAGDDDPISPHEPMYNGNWWATGGMEMQRILYREDGTTTFVFQLTKNGSGSNSAVRFEPGEVKYFTTGLSRTEVVAPGDVKIFHLKEGLNPGNLFQGYGYAYPMEYTRRYERPDGNGGIDRGFEHGPLVLPPGGTVFAKLQASTGSHNRTDPQEPGIGSYGIHKGGPREFGGLHLYHLDEEQMDDDVTQVFYDAGGDTRYLKPHTQRYLVPYPDLRELRLWPSEYVGGQFHVRDDPKRRFTGSELNRVRYFGANDLYLKPVNDDQTRSTNINPAEIFTHHNPRAPVAVPWSDGGRGVNGTRIARTWTTHNRHLEDGRPDGVIGTGIDGESGLWGDGMFAEEGGTDRVVLYEVPRQPLLNLLQLGQANLSFWSHQPMHALGSSRTSPYIEPDRIWQATEVQNEVVSFQFDNAYLLNEALWDGYFFSGVTGWNGLGSASDSLADTLDTFVRAPGELAHTHPRLRFLTSGLGDAAEAGLDPAEYNQPQTSGNPVRPHNRMAQHLLLEGGFNVNSVSVDAWRAVLSGLSGQGVLRVNQQGELRIESLADGLVLHTQSAFLGEGGEGGTGEDYSGFRPLNPSQVDQLAGAIVEEIRERNRSRGGPFLSVADFVNRRLVAAGDAEADQGTAGVLQAAIDSLGDLNREVEEAWGIEPNIDDYFVHRDRNDKPDEVRAPYPNPDAFHDTTRRGMLRHLDQRAVLSVIGSIATVRSDTFRIRAYGSDRGDPGDPSATEAWCEAVVQRMPEFVDPGDEPATPLENASAVNRAFGRRFRVVSFKWLSPEEI